MTQDAFDSACLNKLLRLHCGAKGERNTVVDVSVGGSLLRGACDRSVYAVLLGQVDRFQKLVRLGQVPSLCTA